MKKGILFVVAALLFAGCATPYANFKTATYEARDYDEVWAATVAIVGDVFPIQVADKEKGSIYTGYYVQKREATPARIPEVLLSVYKIPDNLYNLRWRLEAKVYPSEGGTDVSLVVEKEREDTVATTSLAMGNVDAPQASLKPELDTTEGRFAQRWTSLGSDDELEEKLLEKIFEKVSGR